MIICYISEKIISNNRIMENDKKNEILTQEEILEIVEGSDATPGECGDPEISCVGVGGTCKDGCKPGNKDGGACSQSCMQGCSEGCKDACKPGNK